MFSISQKQRQINKNGRITTSSRQRRCLPWWSQICLIGIIHLLLATTATTRTAAAFLGVPSSTKAATRRWIELTGPSSRLNYEDSPFIITQTTDHNGAGSCSRSFTSTAVYSSSGNGDDEIAKLISKRSQIKRKKKEETPAENDITNLPSGESVVDVDLDKLPEFKTERPAAGRRGKKDEDDEGEEDGDGESSKKSKDTSPIVDYMAEYEDENDWHIPNRIGISTRGWGDTALGFVASGKLTKRATKSGKFVPGDVQLAHLKLLEGGITLFVTSPSHGIASRKQNLSAEHIIRRCIEEQSDDVPETMLAVSLGQSPWKGQGFRTQGMSNTLEESLTTLGGLASIELFQSPKSFLFPSTLLANGLAAVLESGQCNYVGVEGVTNAGSLRRLRRKLEIRDVALTSNAFDFSLTNRKNENVIDVCKDLGIIPFVTDPLDGGLASGVYTATNPSGGLQGKNKFTFKELEKLQPLHSVQETVAERVRTRVLREMRDTQERFRSRYGPPPKINSDITTTQVALNYAAAKGGVPLPEVNNPKQAEEVLGCLGWTLADDEVGMLDAAAALCDL